MPKVIPAIFKPRRWPSKKSVSWSIFKSHSLFLILTLMGLVGCTDSEEKSALNLPFIKTAYTEDYALCPAHESEKLCKKIKVETKRTPKEMAQGMMFRKVLGENQGMLFLFKTAQLRAFWMKNTYVPLDIAFFEKGELKHVHAHAKPLDETPIHSKFPADTVLETNAGWFEKHEISAGWRLILQ